MSATGKRINIVSSPDRRSPKRHHKRLSSAALSVATLPEYHHVRQSTHTSLSSTWDATGSYVPPPDYSDPHEEPSTSLGALGSADEADGESDTPPPPRRRSLPHKRSYSAQFRMTSTPDIDSILERSVEALEMSNALLQSSLSTHASLSKAVMSDDEVEPSMKRRTEFESRRENVIRAQEANAMRFIDDVDTILGRSSLSQSAPVTSIHERIGTSNLRIEAPSPPVRSKTPHHTNPSTPQPSDKPSMPSLAVYSPSSITPAYTLPSSVVTRDASVVTKRHSRPTTPPPSPPLRPDGTGHRISSSRLSTALLYETGHVPTPSLRRMRSISALPSFPKSSLRAIMSPSFFSNADRRDASSFPPLSSGKTAQSLRTILHREVAKATVIQDEMSRKYEHSSDSLERIRRPRCPSSPLHSYSSRPSDSIDSEEWIVVDAPPPRKPTLKSETVSASGFNCSTPRTVSFSKLPPSVRQLSAVRRPPFPHSPSRSERRDGGASSWLAEWWNQGVSAVDHEDTDREQLQSEGWLP